MSAMAQMITMRAALSDPNLLGSLLFGPSWQAWRVLLIAAMGEVLTDDERALFKTLTGRDREQGQRVEELVGVIGRRGGKSRAISVLAAFIAGLCDHSSVLAPGERGVCLIIAPDQRQALVVLNYIAAAFESSPMLRQLVESRTADTLSLRTNIDIEVRASSFRRLRGSTLIAVICDEAAFFMTDDSSSNADTAILNAVRPGLATTHGLLAIISSPYARAGELYELHKAHFGAQGDPLILVAQGASRIFNPSLSQATVDRAYARDAAAASAEYGGLFRSDIERFISADIVEAAVVPGRIVLPRCEGVSYVAACDPSGGSSDSMTLAIAHMEGQRAILDLVVERRPPFSPDEVTKEFAATIKGYGIASCQGDHYAGQWPRERFAVHGIDYVASSKTKSEIYLTMLPMLNSGRVELIDNARLVSQLCSLERKTSRVGKDSVDHAPGGHDDVVNAVAGALVLAERRASQEIPFAPPIIVTAGSVSDAGGPVDATRAYYKYFGGGGGEQGRPSWWGR
jgi:hypothetical protein